MRVRRGLPALVLAACLSFSLSPQEARAQQVTLKLHHFVSAASNQQKFWFEPWAKKLEQESGGRLKVEIFPSMQLGGKPPQLFDQAKDGVVDIVWTPAGVTPGRFPRLEVFEIPFFANAVGENNSRAIWQYYQTYALSELKDVKTLAIWGTSRGNLYIKGKELKVPADAVGLKLRATNRQTNDAFALIGALPQSIPPSGVPEALSKGVIDGVTFPYDAVIPFKLDELTDHVSEFAGDRNFYTAVLLFVMNKARYDALPDDLKKVIDANSGEGLSRQLGRWWDEWDQIGKALVVKRHTPIHVIDGADLAEWKKVTMPLVAKWTAERDKAGDKGADLVKAAQDLVAQYSK